MDVSDYPTVNLFCNVLNYQWVTNNQDQLLDYPTEFKIEEKQELAETDIFNINYIGKSNTYNTIGSLAQLLLLGQLTFRGNR